jgi:hypothetical protein
MVPKVGVEPTLLAEHDFESCASANSATSASYIIRNGEPYWTRTSDTLIKSQVLYQLS